MVRYKTRGVCRPGDYQDPDNAGLWFFVVIGIICVGICLWVALMPDGPPLEAFTAVRVCPNGYILERGNQGHWRLESDWARYSAEEGVCGNP